MDIHFNAQFHRCFFVEKLQSSVQGTGNARITPGAPQAKYPLPRSELSAGLYRYYFNSFSKFINSKGSQNFIKFIFLDVSYYLIIKS